MFGGAYAQSKPFEQTKYGCLNISGDISGCNRARTVYGEYILILKPHIRHRCTFFSDDTGFTFKRRHALGTAEYYVHILQQYSDEDLASLLKVVTQSSIGGC
jgi:hypothetical protein